MFFQFLEERAFHASDLLLTIIKTNAKLSYQAQQGQKRNHAIDQISYKHDCLRK